MVRESETHWLIHMGQDKRPIPVRKEYEGVAIYPFVEAGDKVERRDLLCGPKPQINFSPPVFKFMNAEQRKQFKFLGLVPGSVFEWTQEYRSMTLGQFHQLTAERNNDILLARRSLEADEAIMQEVVDGIGDIAADQEVYGQFIHAPSKPPTPPSNPRGWKNEFPKKNSGAHPRGWKNAFPANSKNPGDRLPVDKYGVVKVPSDVS